MPNSSDEQQRLELRAAERVVPWSGLAPNDYDLKSWATARNTSLVRAGCVYEYARESQKLRCLLVLINAEFEKERQAEQSQTQSQPFHGSDFLLFSFKGLRYRDALLELGGWFGWLRCFTDQLADNTSFADLCERNERQVNDSLSNLPKFFYEPKAVEIALPNVSESPIESRLQWPSQALNAHHRNVENDLTITIRIRLRDFNNKEIGREMERLASMLRPSREKEPTRKGTGKRDSPRSWLDALSAIRLASHYPKTLPSGRRKDRRNRPHEARIQARL
jgi:hypothetical protein